MNYSDEQDIAKAQEQHEYPIYSLYDAYKETYKKCMIMIRHWDDIKFKYFDSYQAFEGMLVKPFLGVCNNITFAIENQINSMKHFTVYSNAILKINDEWSYIHNDNKHENSAYFIGGRGEPRQYFYKNMSRLHYLIFLANRVHVLMLEELKK